MTATTWLAMRVLGAGMAIFDKWHNHAHAPFRQIALREKAKALVNHDRILNGYPRN